MPETEEEYPVWFYISPIGVVLLICFAYFNGLIKPITNVLPNMKGRKVIVVPTSDSSKELFEYFLSSFKFTFEFHWEDKTNFANVDVTKPCLIVCYTGARVIDDVESDLAELDLTGRNAMLIVIGHCPKHVKPDRLLTEENKPKNINCVVNIIMWKNEAYDCNLNKKAHKEIKRYCKK